jgi:hypothetical protein
VRGKSSYTGLMLVDGYDSNVVAASSTAEVERVRVRDALKLPRGASVAPSCSCAEAVLERPLGCSVGGGAVNRVRLILVRSGKEEQLWGGAVAAASGQPNNVQRKNCHAERSAVSIKRPT